MARALLASGYGKATPIPRGLLARFTDGVNAQITELDGSAWFGPAQPIPRVAPPGVQPRRYDYRFGQNLDYTPKAFEGEPFALLRDLADAYPLLRCVIETRKDQVARVPHSFGVRSVPGEKPSDTKKRQQNDPRIAKLDEFFDQPDGEHSYSDWQRMILEDMFVIDAPAVVPRWRNDRGLFGFDVIDGATISILIDENGRTPQPPDPGFRQIIKGVPAVDMMAPAPWLPKTDQIFYFPRNVRTNRLYGYSPVEQCALTSNLGLRRRLYQLEKYTAGTIPDAFINAPDGAGEDTIKNLETWWNEKYATTSARRKANFIPAGAKVTIAKQESDADLMDELIIREIAYAFGVSPSSLVKMVNRAAGAQMSEDAKAEGLEPILFWWKEFMDYLLWFMGCGDLEYLNGSLTRENPLQAAQIHQIYLSTTDANGDSPMTADEVREQIGLDPLSEEQKQSAEDEQLHQQQVDRADTMRPKAAGDIRRLALKKKRFASRLALLPSGTTERCAVSQVY